MTTRAHRCCAGVLGVVVSRRSGSCTSGCSTSSGSSCCRRRRSSARSRDRPRFYLDAALVTAWHSAVGIAISLVVAVLIGAVLASSRFLEQAAQPVLIGVLVAPWIAYFTSIVLWLGRGDPPVIFLVAFVTTPAFVFATVAGMRSADPAARELLASVDASRLEVLWRLRLPSALPTILAAARFNLGLALAAAYYGEGGNLSNAGPRRRRTAGDRPERRGAVGDDPVHGGPRRRVPRRPVADRAPRPALARLAAHAGPGAGDVTPGTGRRCGAPPRAGGYGGPRTQPLTGADLLASRPVGCTGTTRSTTIEGVSTHAPARPPRPRRRRPAHPRRLRRRRRRRQLGDHAPPSSRRRPTQPPPRPARPAAASTSAAPAGDAVAAGAAVPRRPLRGEQGGRHDHATSRASTSPRRRRSSTS